MEEGSNEQHQVLQKDSREGANKNVHGRAAKAGKGKNKGRISVVTKSEVGHLDDGYRWRKCGETPIMNSPYRRSYFKCTMLGCVVKKHVERSFQDPAVVITTYKGEHKHPIPSALPQDMAPSFVHGTGEKSNFQPSTP